MAAGYLAAANFLLPVRGSYGTGDNMIGVLGVYYRVTIAMENNGWNGWPIIGSVEVAREFREPPWRIARMQR